MRGRKKGKSFIPPPTTTTIHRFFPVNKYNKKNPFPTSFGPPSSGRARERERKGESSRFFFFGGRATAKFLFFQNQYIFPYYFQREIALLVRVLG